MNILFISPSVLTKLVKGGIEHSTELLCRELTRRGHKTVVAYYPRQTDTRTSDALVEGIHQVAFPDHKIGTHQDTARNAMAFEKILSEEKIDVVVFQCGAGWYFPFARDVAKFNVPVVSSVRTDPCSYYFRYKHRKLRWLNTFTKFLRQRRKFSYNCKVCAATHLLSESLCPRLKMHLSRELASRSRIVAIPNIAPFSAEPVDFSTKGKELLWVGRISFADKRPDLVLQAWKLLQDRFSDWKLRFVGDGDYLPALKKLSSSLGLKNVFFEGFQDPAPYYRSASIFCLTSAYEGFGLVIVEAQALGCVPIAFASFSAVYDTIEDGVSGILVPAFDVEKYAQRLSELMLDPARRSQIAINAQKSVYRFSSETIGGKWEELLLGLVEKYKKPASKE